MVCPAVASTSSTRVQLPSLTGGDATHQLEIEAPEASEASSGDSHVRRVSRTQLGLHHDRKQADAYGKMAARAYGERTGLSPHQSLGGSGSPSMTKAQVLVELKKYGLKAEEAHRQRLTATPPWSAIPRRERRGPGQRSTSGSPLTPPSRNYGEHEEGRLSKTPSRQRSSGPTRRPCRREKARDDDADVAGDAAHQPVDGTARTEHL